MSKISIHALREEGDKEFSHLIDGAIEISIHALREEGDRQLLQTSSVLHYFYPRPPRGGRHSSQRVIEVRLRFLSTPSARRATRTAG